LFSSDEVGSDTRLVVVGVKVGGHGVVAVEVVRVMTVRVVLYLIVRELR
jgi:hypothetical protein